MEKRIIELGGAFEERNFRPTLLSTSLQGIFSKKMKR